MNEHLYDFPVSETFAGYEREMMYGPAGADPIPIEHTLSIDSMPIEKPPQARTIRMVDKKKPKTYEFDSVEDA